MKNQLLLTPAKHKKNYYVSFYKDEVTHEKRELFTPFYGRDYNSENDAKIDAIKYFLRSTGNVGFYNIVTLTECNGMQIADKNEPYMSKTAIERTFGTKLVQL